MSEQAKNDEIKMEEEEQEERTKETSILFEPFFVGILAVSLLAAIWFKFVPLLIVSTFSLVLALLILIWKRQSLKKLEPMLTLPTSRLFAGDEFRVHASVKNNKWLPLIWLEWEFNKSTLVRWEEGLHKTYIVRFLWLLWHQKVEWTVNGSALKRGVYEVGQVTLRSGDGFRFAEKEECYHLNGPLYIYPKLTSVHVPSFQTSLQWEVMGRQGGFLEDPLLINGIREYQVGDEWRRINGRASVRSGKLQTNEFQPIVSEQLMIYIDVRSFSINEEKYKDEPLKQKKYEQKKRDVFESALSVVSSVIMAYDGHGIKIGFATNAINHKGKSSAQHMPNAGVTAVLDELAMLTQKSTNQTMQPLDTLLAKGIRSCPLFIFCERITKEHVFWYKNQQQRYPLYFYYVYENEHAHEMAKVAKPIDHLRGEAVVISL